MSYSEVRPAKGLKVQISVGVPSGKVSLAGGGKITVERAGSGLTATFDCDVADMLIIRK